MSKHNFLTRRRVLSSTAALGALALAGPASASTGEASPIARAWARAKVLQARMAPHARAIRAAFENGGAPGWMRLRGDANALGEARYALIVSILKATPKNQGDLEIQRAAARDPDMIHGPRAWAKAEVERAAGEWGAA